MPSQELKAYLNVSLQSLANWRVRGTGPPHEPVQPGLGNRIWYRPDMVMAWLSGRPWWEFSAEWLAARGLGVDEPASEAAVMDRIQVLEELGVFG